VPPGPVAISGARRHARSVKFEFCAGSTPGQQPTSNKHLWLEASSYDDQHESLKLYIVKSSCSSFRNTFYIGVAMHRDERPSPLSSTFCLQHQSRKPKTPGEEDRAMDKIPGGKIPCDPRTGANETHVLLCKHPTSATMCTYLPTDNERCKM
jgi:hypothetical protein